MRWWGALTCLDLVAKPSPAPEARAGACECSAASAHPVAACATIAGRPGPCGLGATRGAQTSGVRPPPPPPRGREPGRAPSRGAAAHEAEGRRGARGGGAGRVGPPTGWPRLRRLRQIGDELVAGLE